MAKVSGLAQQGSYLPCVLAVALGRDTHDRDRAHDTGINARLPE